MDQFRVFMEMGFGHISDWRGYDHILFLLVLCCVYKFSGWKKVALLVTAFTVGHSVTLALSAWKILVINSDVVEVLIAITILIASVGNILSVYGSNKQFLSHKFLLAVLFGFIHGMGFSSFFNALMGDSMNILWPLFAFNVGLEIGQLIIVVGFLCLHFLAERFLHVQQRLWTMVFSCVGVVVSLVMVFERGRSLLE